MLEGLSFETSEPTGVSYEDVDAGGVPAIWCLPDGAAEDRVVLYTHGGGFVTNTAQSHRKLAGHIAKATGVRALVLDYRLAPEHPFPAQLDDGVAAYKWLLDQGIKAEHIATAGDSAGGNLATSIVLKLRDDGLPLPAAVVGFSPWHDMEHKGSTLETNAATDAFVQKPVLEGMSAMYLGENGSPSDPLANPLHADLAGFPPVFLTAGNRETLQNDAERFAERASAAGVDVTLDVVDGMQHIFPVMAGHAPEADIVIGNLATWLRPKVGLG